MTSPPPYPITVDCEDGYTLHGRCWEPTRAAPPASTVIICPALFVRQRFYASLASYLAQNGFRVLCLANRGMESSLAAEDRTWRLRLKDWGERDLPAIIASARADNPEHRLFAVGHSMGGQVVALSRAVHELHGIVTVAATAAWWGHWPFPWRLAILAWYGGLAPLLARGMSVFPAERFNLGPDVASHLVRDWARWGRHPDYFFGPFGVRPHMAEYRGRVLAYSFTDDQRLGCEAAVEALHRRFTSAPITRRHVDPAELGVSALGHFGYFRRRTGLRLWEETVRWMRRSQS